MMFLYKEGSNLSKYIPPLFTFQSLNQEGLPFTVVALRVNYSRKEFFLLGKMLKNDSFANPGLLGYFSCCGTLEAFLRKKPHRNLYNLGIPFFCCQSLFSHCLSRNCFIPHPHPGHPLEGEGIFPLPQGED